MSQIISSAIMRMTSIEISDLVGSRHGSVKRAIERLATPKDDGTPAVIQLPPMVQVENNQSLSPNSRSKAYLFQGEQGRRDSIVVVAQLSPEFTARLVDRWQELEEKQTPATPKTYIEALEKLLESEKEKLVLKEELKAAEPKVEFVNNYVDAKGNKTFRGLVKMLNVNEREFRNWLHDSKIMYRLNGAWMPYSEYLHKGYFEVKTGENDGKSYSLCYFTPKGEVWIAEKWNKRNTVAKA